MKCVFCGRELGKEAPATIVMKDKRTFPACLECATEKLRLLLTAIANITKQEKKKKEASHESS